MTNDEIEGFIDYYSQMLFWFGSTIWDPNQLNTYASNHEEGRGGGNGRGRGNGGRNHLSLIDFPEMSWDEIGMSKGCCVLIIKMDTADQ